MTPRSRRWSRYSKVNRVYRDPELYGYPVGAISRDGDWVTKTGNPQWSYGAANLGKVHLSVPCFVANVPRVRRRVRHLYQIASHVRLARSVSDQLLSGLPRQLVATRPPPNTVHFIFWRHQHTYSAWTRFDCCGGPA